MSNINDDKEKDPKEGTLEDYKKENIELKEQNTKLRDANNQFAATIQDVGLQLQVLAKNNLK